MQFENKNYQELSGNAEYSVDRQQRNLAVSRRRSPMKHSGSGAARQFQRITEGLQKQEEKTGQTLRAAVVVHGGTIMAILELLWYT